MSNQWRGSNRSKRLPSNWPILRSATLKRDNYLCQLSWLGCERRATEVDHKNRGDDHRPENLQSACKSCHAKKSALEGNQAKAALRAARFRKPAKHPGRRG
ncbi:HNH endonuclease [Saccharopolyspora pogona]|uniref:HNH endonuclease n=1 Tax=Saccharopolyspora pogona TaxID=333966 RepID=UPI00168A2021